MEKYLTFGEVESKVGYNQENAYFNKIEREFIKERNKSESHLTQCSRCGSNLLMINQNGIKIEGCLKCGFPKNERLPRNQL